jgi:hypothetical protein
MLSEIHFLAAYRNYLYSPTGALESNMYIVRETSKFQVAEDTGHPRGCKSI